MVQRCSRFRAGMPQNKSLLARVNFWFTPCFAGKSHNPMKLLANIAGVRPGPQALIQSHSGGRRLASLRYAPPAVTNPNISFIRRLALALATFLRILASGSYAARILQLESAQAPAAAEAEPVVHPEKPARDLRPALQVLSVLQREGRLIDFVQQDIITFSDSDVGAAARVVHDGCRRALKRIAKLVPVHEDAEGHSVTVPAGYDAASLQLTGNVSGQPPFRGTLRHRGWRAKDLTLPDVIGETDCTVLAPAEVEL
jgi:hypothetical protein